MGGSVQYRVNDIYASIQGEGHLVGTPMVVVRLSGCNLRCTVESAGFDCDTEFESGRYLGPVDIARRAGECGVHDEWALLTGGEPLRSADALLIDELRRAGFKVAVETNGTYPKPCEVDWIACSPKTAEHTLRVGPVNELRYVRRCGQGLPVPALAAEHRFISPAFQPDGALLREDLDWCLRLVREEPGWRLSVQLHKLIGAT